MTDTGYEIAASQAPRNDVKSFYKLPRRGKIYVDEIDKANPHDPEGVEQSPIKQKFEV